jgi:hypothetical protein
MVKHHSKYEDGEVSEIVGRCHDSDAYSFQCNHSLFGRNAGRPDQRESSQNLLFRRQNLLHTYLIDQVIALQISQMRSLLVVCQVRADPIDTNTITKVRSVISSQ